MRVLLVEDDAATAQSIELFLSAERFNVYATDLGEEGIDLGKLYDYDLILLDLNLPDMSGYEVLRTLRMAKVDTPVLILTGLAGIEDKIRAFGFGADDYMTKPFHRDELIARIHAIVRRSRGHAHSVIQTGVLTVNLDRKEVEVEGQTLHLTGKEYQMLELLSLRKGATLTKEMFLNHLYGGRDEPELKIVDVFICKLRKKLAAAIGSNYIQTVWGRGYVLREPDLEQVEYQPPEPIPPDRLTANPEEVRRLRAMLGHLRDEARPPHRDPKSAKGRRNRLAVLEAARDLFLADGYEATRMRRVVADVHLSLGLIQYFFGNKLGVALALLDELDHLPAETVAA